MRYLKFLLILFVPGILFAQKNNTHSPAGEFRLKENIKYSLSLNDKLVSATVPLKNTALYDSITNGNKPVTKTVKGSKKSPGLAFIYGLFIPGMGHVYANKFNTGKYFMISEAALWLTYAAFSIYGNWMLDDAYSYAETHAGVTVGGKERDDKFFVDIANYSNVDEYNNERLRFGEYDKLYLPENGYYFWWNSDEERRLYRADKIGGDRTLNDRLFVVGAVLINHVISAISAVFAANSYNDELKSSSGGFRVNAGVIKRYNRVDGIKLSLSGLF
ncbi:MAG: hypothetical protein UZ05_CHB002002639 [Chlorobi bacterium OLB5]|nr:MAG: hypothetical protein UZ05_CHB002002639 [Chlorobi bacterium OLB5]